MMMGDLNATIIVEGLALYMHNSSQFQVKNGEAMV